MAAARASSISAMPPLVMPWRARKPSSVCTSTSKIALPIPRTSYFASAVSPSCLRQPRKAAAYQLGPAPASEAAGAQFRIMRYRTAMIRAFLTVSTGTLASRLLGFVRDSMIAALLGAGPIADAFLAAFQMVNVVRRLLTEGGLNASLVPAWLRVRDTDGAAAAAAFAGRVLGTITAALFAGTLLLALLMPLVLMVLAPGFSGGETLQLAVDDARLMLPYLAFAGPVTVMMALLNAQGRFALTAFSPVLFNIALIAVMFVLLASNANAVHAAQILAATVGVAGLLQLSILLLRRGSSIATPLRMSFDKEIRGFLAKAVPGMIAS